MKLEGGAMQNLIKTLTEICNELAVVGDGVEEEDYVVHFLANLPPSSDTLVTALETCQAVPTMETIQSFFCVFNNAWSQQGHSAYALNIMIYVP